VVNEIKTAREIIDPKSSSKAKFVGMEINKIKSFDSERIAGIQDTG